jgi:hypothetical protein
VVLCARLAQRGDVQRVLLVRGWAGRRHDVGVRV